MLSSAYEVRLFEYAFFSDSATLVDPFGQPFSITDEIKMLESLESQSKLPTRGVVERSPGSTWRLQPGVTRTSWDQGQCWSGGDCEAKRQCPAANAE